MICEKAVEQRELIDCNAVWAHKSLQYMQRKSLLCLILALYLTPLVQAISMGQAICTTQFYLYGRKHFTEYVEALLCSDFSPFVAELDMNDM